MSETRKVGALRPHPKNAEIYTDTPDDEFVASVRQHGILTPLMVTRDNVIISGHRRHRAAMAVGLLTVPVEVALYTDDLDIRQALVESNRQRAKTPEEVGREVQELFAIEGERAKRRKQEAVARGNRTRHQDARSPDMVNSPHLAQGDAGLTRDKVGERVGMSGWTAHHLKRVMDVIDQLEREGNVADVALLRGKLNNGVNGAYVWAQRNGYIKRRSRGSATPSTHQHPPIPEPSPEQMALLESAARARNWTDEALDQAKRNVVDSRVPDWHKEELLAGQDDPLDVTRKGGMRRMRVPVTKGPAPIAAPTPDRRLAVALDVLRHALEGLRRLDVDTGGFAEHPTWRDYPAELAAYRAWLDAGDVAHVSAS